MPLDKQLVSVDFTGGLDTKTDAKLVLPGKLTRLENGAFREKSIGKRYGSAALSTVVAQGGTIGSVTGIAASGGTQIAESGGSLYARTAGGWSKVVDAAGLSTPLFATLDRTPVVHNSRIQQDWDSASVGAYVVYAWSETSNAVGIHAMVLDSATGAVVVADTIVNTFTLAGGGSPRVISDGSNKAFVLFARTSGNLSYVAFDATAAASGFGAQTDLVLDTSLDSNGRFDVATGPHGFYVAYADSGGVAVTNFDLTFARCNAFSTGSATGAGSRGVSLATMSNTTFGATNVVAAWHDGTQAHVLFMSDNAAGNHISNTGSATMTVAAFDRCTLLARSTTDIMGMLDTGSVVYSFELSASTVTLAPSVTLYNARLLSRLVAYGSTAFAAVVNQPPSGSTAQPTGFIIEYSGLKQAAVGRVLPGLCGAPAGSRLGTPSVSSGVYSFLFPERGRLAYASDGSGAIDKTALGFSRIDFTPCNLKDLPTNQVGPLLYIGGARPLIFDGRQVFDAGFQCIPEGLSVSSGGAGSLSAGTYGFQAVYSFTDAQGHLHRSAPSPLVQYTATASDSASVTGLSLTETMLGQYTVWVELYRTAANGTVMYRTGTPPGATVNSVNSATWGASSSGSDAALAAGEVLYTEGGALDNIGPPAYRAACVHQNRLFLFGLEDPYEIRFSTEYVSGEGLRFNEVLTMRVPAATGKVICGASMDDKLVVFAERAVYVVVGSGPDALGLNNSYSEPQLVPTASGCSVPQSVVVTQDGTMFRGAQGMSLLGHDLSVQFIGAEMDDFNSDAITSAVVVADQNQVRFGTDSGVTLVYDYLMRQWSTFAIGSVAAVLWDSVYTRLLGTGEIRQETVGSFLEAGSAYSLLAESAWLKPAGVQGFQRIWRALVLGDCKSQPTSFATSVGYDYDPAYASADQASFTGSLTAGKPFQIRLHLRKQKCEAIRFLLTETPSGGTNEGISLSSLMLEVGVRRGAFKLSGGNTAIQGP